MALLEVSCDVDAAVKQIKALAEDQLPFIIAKSLTSVAQEAQKAVRFTEGQVFRLRNDWTTQNTKITPATKQSFVAQVYTDTANRKTGAPDYLPGQESGLEKVPHGGHKHLAIPTRYLYAVTPKSRPIPDNLRPSALLPPNAQMFHVYGGTFAAGSRSTGTKRLIGRAILRKLGNGEFTAFFQRTKGGTLCIFVRHGGMGYKAGSQQAEPWYTLVYEASIRPRLRMEDTVAETVNREFPEIFYTVADQALRSSFIL